MWSSLTNTGKTIILLGCSFLLLITSWLGVDQPLKDVFYQFTSPLLQATTTTHRSLKNLAWVTTNASSISQENQNLRQENLTLQAQITQMEELRVENKNLRQQLQLEDSANFGFISSQVIGHTNWSRPHQILINKGQADNLQEGQAVVIAQGILVGYLQEVYEKQSLVTLISSPQAKIPSLIQESRTNTLLVGQSLGQTLELQYIPSNLEITTPATIVTSKLAYPIPSGLLIGYLHHLRHDQQDIYHKGDILPAADLSRLEWVMVVTPTPQ